MRELILKQLTNCGWLDSRWDSFTKEFTTYLDYLRTQNDEELLEIYSRVQIAQIQLDQLD